MIKDKYLKYIPKPLLEDIVKNNVIPFVGAGFSKNAEYDVSVTMPDWYELGRKVSESIDGYNYSEPIDAFSYYEALYSRPALVSVLMNELLYGKVRPSTAHENFCKLFKNIIFTTNYDSLLEDQLKQLSRPTSVIVEEERLSINIVEETKVIKLHGDFDHPAKMVITEDDYDLYINRNPIFATFVSSCFVTNTMLLVGYSLNDADFRSMWKIINDRLGKLKRTAYSIQVDASNEEVEKFKRRGITVINIPGNKSDYKRIYTELFAEIGEYVNRQNQNSAESSDEKVNEQLILPAESNRLCFLSCTWNRLSLVKKVLRPVLVNNHISVISADQIETVGGNIIDSIETSVNKSKFVIIDLSSLESTFLPYEISYVLRTKEKENILFIADEETMTSANLDSYRKACEYNKTVVDPNFRIITYSSNKAENNEFYDKLNSMIAQCIKESSRSFAVAERLIEKEEYSAAVVSGYSDFEFECRNRLVDEDNHSNKVPLWELTRNFELTNEQRAKLNDITKMRNAIVHLKYEAKKKEAINAIYFLKDLVAN